MSGPEFNARVLRTGAYERLPDLASPVGVIDNGRVGWLVLAPFWILLTLADMVRELALWKLVSAEVLAIAGSRSVLSTLVWASVSFIALGIADRLPLRGLKEIAYCSAAGIILALTANYLQSVFSCYPFPSLDCSVQRRFAGFLFTLPTSILITINLIVVGYAMSFGRRHREREERKSRLEAAATGARLTALDIQLRPHFLFNTLQSVTTLMHRDVAAAEMMLERLQVLLRHSFEADAPQLVPLRSEFAILEAYVAIEKVRYGDRLQLTMTAPPEAENALVPRFLLQPLVENAIRHVVAIRGRVRVDVQARLVGERLLLTVSDDGTGLSESGTGSGGVGLENVRARLATLYGSGADLTLGDRPGLGLTVTISVPRSRWSLT